MPKLMNNSNDDVMEVVKTGGGFHFSAIRMDNLEASEYSLITIVLDLSGSVASYASELLKCVKTIIEACKKSPRSENLMIRIIGFNNRGNINEIHGFKLLSFIDVNNDYKPLNCGGMTCLADATYNAIQATLTYSTNLIAKNYSVNGAIYIITDGCDNDSYHTSAGIKKFLNDTSKKEVIESLLTILIGVNVSGCKNEIDAFKNDSGLSEFVDIGDGTAQKLAKLAGFVFKSISSVSQSINQGMSQPVVF